MKFVTADGLKYHQDKIIYSGFTKNAKNLTEKKEL
jgi:hypothetical protein